MSALAVRSIRHYQFGIFVVSLLLTPMAFAQIDGSRHDLATGGADNDEVCVYCHTPHGAANTASAPLWNKPFSTATYTRYSSLNTSTLEGTEAAVGSVSLACLSCHDGTQAMDSVINAPTVNTGQHNYTAGGAAMGALGFMSGTPVPNLETDLSDDHPISIQYAAGSSDNATIPYDASYGDAIADFKDPDFNTLQTDLINGTRYWWIDTAGGNPGARDKTDVILYTRNEPATGGLGDLQPFVECGSCHDPHSTTNTPFLRVSNANSGVCLACHDK